MTSNAKSVAEYLAGLSDLALDMIGQAVAPVTAAVPRKLIDDEASAIEPAEEMSSHARRFEKSNP